MHAGGLLTVPLAIGFAFFWAVVLLAYLPHMFGPAGYTVLRKPEELPMRLPILYAQLTGK